MLRRKAVSPEPIPGNGLAAGQTDIGHLPEVLPAAYVGDMDLHRGDPHRLHGVQQSNAGMGVCGGIDDNAVEFFVRALVGVN